MEIRKIDQEPNELHPETQGIIGISSFISTVSASRKQMYGNNLGQNVVVRGANQRWIQSGMDTLLADTTFAIRMPSKGSIVQIIPRYKDKGGPNDIKVNPQTIAIYQDSDTREYGMVDLVNHANFHPYLGFDYVDRPAFSEIRVDKFFDKDTVFRDSPGVTEDGDYNFSVTCNVALISLAGTAEDGIVFNEDSLEKFTYNTYETRVVEFGSKDFPLHIYPGADGEYTIFPNIGEYVRDDGILMAKRSYNPMLSAVEQSVNATRRIDFSFDQCVYADPGGQIVDIQVWHTPSNGPTSCPPTMEEQPLRYDVARREFYQTIYDLDQRLSRGGAKPSYSRPLHDLIEEAISVIQTTNRDGQKIRLVHKATPIDEWRIKFIIKSVNKPNIGHKFTDLFGGKGVVCSIKPAKQMPRDQYGNVADMAFDPAGLVNRMIAGRSYEGYFNSASRDVYRQLSIRLGVDQSMRRSIITQHLMKVEREQPALLAECWEYLMAYYDVTVPETAHLYRNGLHGSTPVSHLSTVLKEGHPTLHIRCDHELEWKNMASDVERTIAPLFGPVSFEDAKGNLITTKNNIRIAPMSIVMLEKLADTWSATASGRYQHHGVLATLSNADKYSQAIRSQPTKIISETEGRLVASYVNSWGFAEIMDRNNSPIAHKFAVTTLMRAEKPTNIDHIIDRSKVPIGGSKPAQMVNHIFSCSGKRFAYAPFVSPNPKPAHYVPSQQH